MGDEERTQHRAVSAAVALIVAISGCAATWTPLDVAALERAKPRTMLLVYRRSETFLGPNRNPLMGGLLAYVAMQAAGTHIRDENHIEDPAHDLGEEIAVAFAQKKGLLVESLTEPPDATMAHEETDGVTVQQPVLPPRDLYLEVKTSNWGVDAPLLGVATVFYTFSAKLIEGKTHQVLAEGDCGTSNLAAQRAQKRSYEDVLAERAAIVKREIYRTVEECREKVSAQIFFAPVTLSPRVPTGKAVAVPPPPSASRAESFAPVPQQSDDE